MTSVRVLAEGKPGRKNYRDLWLQLKAIVGYSPKRRYTQEELIKLLEYMEKGKLSKND